MAWAVAAWRETHLTVHGKEARWTPKARRAAAARPAPPLPAAVLAAVLLLGPPARALLACGGMGGFLQALRGGPSASHGQACWSSAGGASLRRGRLRAGGRTGAAARCAGEGDCEQMAPADQDWRDFRARLVERERLEGGEGVAEGQDCRAGDTRIGWAYEMPLIEQGAVLLSAPGDHFALQQQYFHKAVILIVRHSEDGDMGLILNRPTAFRAGDLQLPCEDPLPDRVLKFLGLPAGCDAWNVWFGGDCHGPGPGLGDGALVCSCLHTSERLADKSERIIRGVFAIDLERARELVALGLAERDEFLLLAGYCGWGPGQLQAELDQGGSWIVAATDQRALLGELRDAQASLTSRLEAARARSSDSRVTAADVGDGIAHWEQLLAALEPQAQSKGLAEGPDDEGAAAVEAHVRVQVDGLLRRWIEQRLLPAPPALELAPLPRTALRAGTVLRGSATAWLLGGPPALLLPDGPWRISPAQYLHKAVLLLLEDYTPDRSSTLVLLDGPKIGEISGGAGAVFFGGPTPTPPEVGGLLAVPGGGVWGCVELPPGLLTGLLVLGGFEVAEGVTLPEATAVPTEERWAAAGGRIRTLQDALTAAQGDEQRRRWYKSFLGLEADADL